MHFKNILFFLLATVSSTFSQINWVSQPVPQGISILLTIELFNYNNGFSGGWQLGGPDISGAGVYTTNGGNNWLNSSFPDSMRAFIYTRLFDNLNGISVGAFNHNSFTTFNFREYINSLDQKKDFTKLSYAKIGYRLQSPTGGIILKTQNGGSSWELVSVLPDSFTYITAGCFLNENTGFIVATNDSLTYILKTSDAGVTWNIKFTFPPYSGSRCIVFSSPQNGIAAGYTLNPPEQEGYIVYTNDVGENWNYVLVPQTAEMASASFSEPNIFYATGQNSDTSQVYKSTDGGVTWTQTSFYATGYILNRIDFLAGTGAGLLLADEGFNPFVSKTNDYGSTWSAPEFISGFSGYLIYGSKVFDENNVYLSGGDINSGLILKTTNAGIPVELVSFTGINEKDKIKLNWATASELNNKGFEIERSNNGKDFIARGFVKGSGTSTERHEYSFTEDAIKGKIYYRLKQIDFDGNYTYSKSVEINSVYASNFELIQNYPNPFNPTTSIQYAISSSQFISLIVYDVLGNEVVILVNKEKPAGRYEVEFDGSSLPSGVYFYQLKAGNFIETRKMILMK